MKTLLTALELIRHSPLTKDFPPSKLCPIIEAAEESIFEDCALGVDLYEALLDALTDVPANTKEWNVARIYAQGDIATYYGTVIKSLTDNNSLNPCVSGWEVVPKFTSECINEFWCKLRLYLSYFIVAENVTILTYELGGKGTTKWSDDFRQNTSGIITVERGERVDFQNAIHKMAEKYYRGILRYLERNNETCPILKNASYVKDLCTRCEPISRTRRIKYNK